MKILKAILLALFASKRALTFVAGLLLMLVNPLLVKMGLDFTPDQVAEGLYILGLLVMGAGIGDAITTARADVAVAKPSDTQLLNPFTEGK